MARAVRKIRRPIGTRDPSRTSTPSANAMSVAIGTPQPRAASASPLVMSRNRIAGRTAPPTAAVIGRAARRTDASSPTRTSRLISRPTTRKKIAISPSLIHTSSDFDSV